MTSTLGCQNCCPFCALIASGPVLRVWPEVVAFEPRHPVTPGHLLVVPVRHVPDAAAEPGVTAAVMRCAAQLAAELGGAANLITSIGHAASQTVYHLHIHVVPRAEGDGLTLPWTGQPRPEVTA